MNNEIGRKITSLTLMTIMIAGGMTFAVPGIMPAAHAANANLFVSAENSQFDNYMSGPQVIEVVVIDSDINDTDEAKGEPDVTVNGKVLRMVQAVDGNWYGYFADRTMATLADGTTTVANAGLDFGAVCTDAQGTNAVGIDLGDADGAAFDTDNNCIGIPAITNANPVVMNVLREAKEANTSSPAAGNTNPPNVTVTAWPFIQLYDLNPTGNVVVQYNKGGGVQTTTLTFDTAQDYASADLDRSVYGADMEIHATITDLWLNIDPTDEDSWTFATVDGSNAAGSYYQVFDENGNTAGDAKNGGNGSGNIQLDSDQLSNLMCDDNCELFLNADTQNSGSPILTLQDTDDSALIPLAGSDDPTVFQTVNNNLLGEVPVTVTEQGPNSGIFSTSDEGDVSSLKIVSVDTFVRGKTATLTYNDDPVSILTGYITGSIDIQPVDDEWNSGEEIPVIVNDGDLNLNSRADEDLDLFNPQVDHIPTLTIGDPITLENVNSATLVDNANEQLLFVDPTQEQVEKFSQRAFLRTAGDTGLADGDTLRFDMGIIFDDFYDIISEPNNPPSDSGFNGVNLFNYDIRSVIMNSENSIDGTTSIDNFDIILSDGTNNVLLATGTNDAQDLLNLAKPVVATTTATFTDDAADGLNNPTAEIAGIVGAPVPNFFDGPVEISQGGTVATATFTDNNAPVGLDTGSELTAVVGAPVGGFTNGVVTISQPIDVYNDMNQNADVLVDFIFHTGGDAGDEINPGTLPVVVDFFSFGFIDDGVTATDRVANEIIRIEAEETGDNTGLFAGSLEYTMLNQLNILDEDTYENLSTIADDPTFIVIEDLTDEDAPRVNYLEIIDDGVPTKRADQEEAPSHSGIVSFDLDTYKVADTVYVTLEDQDLNTDSDLLEIYTTVSDPSDIAFGAVGEANLPDLEFGPLGRLLDVTFDDVAWKTPQGTCAAELAGTDDTGLDDVTFSLVETGAETGKFIGSFEIPDRWCRADDASVESTTGLDLEVNYVDFRDTSGETIEVGDSAGIRAHTGSVSLDRTVYPVPFGNPSDFATTSETSPDGRSIFPIHQTGVNTAGTPRSAAGLQSGEFLSEGDLQVHLRVNDPDFDTSAAGENFIAQNRADLPVGPVEISVIRGADTVILGFAGGPTPIDGTINVGTNLIGDGMINLLPSPSIELSQFNGGSGFANGAVKIDQGSGANAATTATATFTNIGTGQVDETELTITNSDTGFTNGAVTITQGGSTAAATYTDANGDGNVESGELEVTSSDNTFGNGAVTITQGSNIAKATFADDVDSIDQPGELAITGAGANFVNGQVTISQVGATSATATFTDTPTVRQFGPIEEIAPDAGIFELDLPIRYTDGPADARCPETDNFEPLDGTTGTGELNRFNQVSAGNENFCILQGDILQVEYEDPTDASGDKNTVTDSATFDLRNGVLQSDKSVYIIGSDMILTLIEPDLDLDNDAAETWDLDLIEWDSDAATVTMGNADGEGAAFDPEPTDFRETGDSTGIFQIVIEIPEVLQGDKLERGEESILEYTDWGPSGSDFVGDEDEDVNLTLYTSNFGATVELDQKVYSWTDKIYVTIVAPDHNFDSDLVDEIGNTDVDPIKVSTRGFDLDNYKLVETGTDTGIFTGEVILTGFPHDADGDPNTGDNNGSDTNPRTGGEGPTDGFLESDDDDGVTVSFEFSEDETVVGSALIRWNIGEVQWLEASYPASGTGVVRIIDPDMNLDPEAVDNFDADVWSDSDAGGIDLTVTETNEATGIFEGTVFFTVTDESSGHRLRVAEGDTVTAEYQDNTLPDPYTTADELDITATSLIGTVVPPLERAPIASCRVVDAFGNTLSSVSVDQQVQITCDLANGQDREQAFAYLVQIQDGNGVTVSLAWITGSLSAGQSFSPALSWIPQQSGAYDATTFVWESVDNPTALSPPVDTSITVN